MFSYSLPKSLVNLFDSLLINTILLVLVASVGLGIAIAIGWGLKDSVDELAKEQVKKYRSKK